MSAHSSNPDPVPVVIIGWGRENGVVFMPKIFAEHKSPYVMTAMMDFEETLEPYRYSTHNLGVILHNLHPRPRALIIGIAVPPSLTDKITAVWNEYVDSVLKKEFKDDQNWKKNAVSPLSLTHYVDPAIFEHPPMDMGWEKEMFKHLDAVFRPEIQWD
ncbi:hypothetical protein Forpe1208_v013649 [Fusarium oxysporum f. sp. rapae]|uniref:Uncharacterized protein n=1 Tax=Fusarium oxysporum f. sp. rapae TaxID=485398 RepID=A0A8J5NJY2_FUSOX|nr:hypothetical protein Forpe1208_v013649 [Fusarium oxysporum f. sp. rapae]